MSNEQKPLVNTQGMKDAALELLALQGKVAEAEAMKDKSPRAVLRATYNATPPRWQRWTPRPREDAR